MWESFNWYKRKNYKIHIFKKKIEDPSCLEERRLYPHQLESELVSLLLE